MPRDRQDVDLSVAVQLRALRDYAEKNGCAVAREYVDEPCSNCGKPMKRLVIRGRSAYFYSACQG